MAPHQVFASLDDDVRRRGRPTRTRLHLELRLLAHPFQPLRADPSDRLGALGELGHRDDRGVLESGTLGRAQARDEDEGVGRAPLGVAVVGELAEHAVIALLRESDARSRGSGHHSRELRAKPPPVGAEVVDLQRLDRSRAEPQVHPLGTAPRRGLERVGVEAELQHVAGLRLLPSELRVDGLVGHRTVLVDDAEEEVGDAADAVVDEGHLVDDVVPLAERVADSGHPRRERLAVVPFRDPEDRQALRLVVLEARGLVLETLRHEQPGERAERAVRHLQQPVLDLVLEREVVVAVEPRGDARRRDQPLRHRVTGGLVHRRSVRTGYR